MCPRAARRKRVGMHVLVLLLLLLTVAVCDGSSGTVSARSGLALFEAWRMSRRSRGVHELLAIDTACRPAVAKCMAALTFAPNPDPGADPSRMADDMARCASEQCGCAGAPAAYDPLTQTCRSGGEPLDTHFEGAQEATVFSQATCAQAETCLHGTCEVAAWARYTVDLADCDAMWYCMRRTLGAQVAACRAGVTRDAHGTLCNQSRVCTRLEAVHAAMPAGAPDCEYEYAQIMADAVVQSQIEEACAGVACACVRRGAVGVCDGATSCCVNGRRWDAFELSEGGMVYDALSCSEAELCVPAVAFCKLVAEPDKRLPDVCRGHSYQRYRGRERPDSCYAPAQQVYSSGRGDEAAQTHCVLATTNPCLMVASAAGARCNTAPKMYQTCPAETTPDAGGRCVCNQLHAHTSTCSSTGNCLFTPVGDCAVEAHCGPHAVRASVNTAGDGCDCECAQGWTGTRCDEADGTATSTHSDTWDVHWLVLVCVVAGFTIAAVCIVFWRRVCGGGGDAGCLETVRAPSLENSFLMKKPAGDEREAMTRTVGAMFASHVAPSVTDSAGAGELLPHTAASSSVGVGTDVALLHGVSSASTPVSFGGRPPCSRGPPKACPQAAFKKSGFCARSTAAESVGTAPSTSRASTSAGPSVRDVDTQVARAPPYDAPAAVAARYHTSCNPLHDVKKSSFEVIPVPMGEWKVFMDTASSSSASDGKLVNGMRVRTASSTAKSEISRPLSNLRTAAASVASGTAATATATTTACSSKVSSVSTAPSVDGTVRDVAPEPAEESKATVNEAATGAAGDGAAAPAEAPAGAGKPAEPKPAHRFVLSGKPPGDPGRSDTDPQLDARGRFSVPEMSLSSIDMLAGGRWPRGARSRSANRSSGARGSVLKRTQSASGVRLLRGAQGGGSSSNPAPPERSTSDDTLGMTVTVRPIRRADSAVVRASPFAPRSGVAQAAPRRDSGVGTAPHRDAPVRRSKLNETLSSLRSSGQLVTAAPPSRAAGQSMQSQARTRAAPSVSVISVPHLG